MSGPICLRDVQQAREMALAEHADSGTPQAVLVRSRVALADGLEYFVAPVDAVGALSAYGWKVDTVVGDDYLPHELRQLHVALSSEEAGATAAVLAEYWGTQFLVAAKNEAFAAIAVVAWPDYEIRGWRAVPGSRIPPGPDEDLRA